MTALFANQGFDTALIALIVAVTAYVQQRVSQAKQGAQLDAVQQQQAKQGAVLVPVVPAQPVTTGEPQNRQTVVAASVQCPHCQQQVHLDSLIPAPEEAPTGAGP